MEDRNRLLIVDDNKENIRVLIEILKRDYQLNAITDGFATVEVARKWNPDVILLDVVMPEISGYDVCMQLKACEETKSIPVIFVTSVSDEEEEISCIKTGALDYITKPINPRLLSAKVKNFIEIKNDRVILSKLLNSKKVEIEQSVDDLLGVTISVAEFRDSELGKRHVARCVEYVEILVKALIANVRFSELLSPGTAAAICAAAPFHDIGKSMLPDEIIRKPDKLSPEEFDIIKTHVSIGAELACSVTPEIGGEVFLKIAHDMIMYHHERWDGTGYPEGLKGVDIPLCARIMAIADQYDALISKRIYKEPTYHFEAVRTIASESGKGLDPELVQEFLGVQDEFLAVMQKYTDKE